jgi:hypothetical protein
MAVRGPLGGGLRGRACHGGDWGCTTALAAHFTAQSSILERPYAVVRSILAHAWINHFGLGGFI